MTDMLRWMNYHHLRAFAAVVEEGGLTPAASRLHVTHPTLSEQIRRLEESLGTSLFDREGRRLVLNETGRMVFEYAEQIFGIGSALLDAVEDRTKGQSLSFRVGVDSVLPKLSVKKELTPLLDAHGDSLRLRCWEGEREGLEAQLRGRQLDLVLSDGPALDLHGRALESRELATSCVAFFAHSDLLRSPGVQFPNVLDGLPFLLPLQGTRLRRDLDRWFYANRLRPRAAAELADSALLKAFGQDARGAFAMPASLTDEVCAQFDVEILGTTDEVESSLFALHRAPANPAVDAFFAARDTAHPQREGSSSRGTS